MIFDVKDTRGPVGALEEFAELNEFPTFVVRHGRFANALEQLGRFKSPFEKLVSAAVKQTFGITSQEEQVHAIDLLPHLDGDLFAYGPGIFSCEGQAGVD